LQSDVPVLVDLERFCVVIGQRCLEMDASLLLSSSAYSDYSDLYCMKTPWCDQNPVKWGLPGRYTRYTRKSHRLPCVFRGRWLPRNGIGAMVWELGQERYVGDPQGRAARQGVVERMVVTRQRNWV
jgi:hypothetical protein